jgi:hypothetical protein
MNLGEQAELQALEARIKTLLPEEYQDSYDEILPVSMGSAGLKFDADGKVAWDEIWGSFCDLAMAGGPPHKGMLLKPGSPEAIAAEPDRYAQVVKEICRGISMVTDLATEPSRVPGWVEVDCDYEAMAGWLVRAIVMENVSAQLDGTVVYLPAGPAYRIEKEIKNVITVIAKTCHYWLDHMWAGQHRDIASLFSKMEVDSPLIQPALAGYQTLRDTMAELIHQRTGLPVSNRAYAGWIGVEYPSVRSAIWVMRAMVASNVLSRREETTLFLPVNPVSDPSGEAVVQAFVRVHGFAINAR